MAHIGAVPMDGAIPISMKTALWIFAGIQPTWNGGLPKNSWIPDQVRDDTERVNYFVTPVLVLVLVEAKIMTAKEDTGSVAVVTGGAGGISLGCAMALAAKGFNLALVDVLEAELKEATGKLRATGVRAESFVADVSNFEKAEEVTEDILERYESISVLVNNAGIGSSKGLLEISESE